MLLAPMDAIESVTELLMDTGLGCDGYSIIGQGRISEIVSAKSTDRREIFEEAAGIARFRHRKDESERKLARTEDNLLRIGDKITELELQVEPLRQQAEKAQKYLTLKGELQGLEVTVWLDSLDKVAESAKKAQEDYASAAFILEQAHDELNTLYHQAEQMALQLNQKSLELDLLRENITSLQTERQKKEADVSVLQAQVEHLQQNIERARHEMDEQSARSGSIAETMEERQQAIAALDEACAQLDAQVQEKTAQASEVQRELGAAQQALLQRAAGKSSAGGRTGQKDADCVPDCVDGRGRGAEKDPAGGFAGERNAPRTDRTAAGAVRQGAGRRGRRCAVGKKPDCGLCASPENPAGKDAGAAKKSRRRVGPAAHARGKGKHAARDGAGLRGLFQGGASCHAGGGARRAFGRTRTGLQAHPRRRPVHHRN